MVTDLRSDQLAPHSIEAEEAVLGSILVNSEALFEVIPFLTDEDFFIVRHAYIWQAIIALHDRKDPIDYLTIVSELEQMGRLAEVGGAAYVLGLVNKTPSSLNCEGYGHIVERMALRRRYIDAARQVAMVAHSDETDIDEVRSKAENAVLAASSRMAMHKWHRFSDKNIDPRDAGQTKCLVTNCPEIDKVMDYQIGYGTRTSVLAASMTGKTSVLVAMAVDWALQDIPIRFVSMEKKEDKLRSHMARYLAFLERMTYDAAWERLAKCDISILDERVFMRDIENSLRGDVANGLGVLFIDTIQKLKDADSRQGVTAASLQSASAAVEEFKLDSGWCVVDAVQQYVETNSMNPALLRPSRNNVKGAKAIFEDDDNMIGFYRADVWRHEYGANFVDDKCGENEVDIRALKIRDGDTFKYKYLKLAFVPSIPAIVSPSMLAGPVQQTFAAASHPNGNGHEDLI